MRRILLAGFLAAALAISGSAALAQADSAPAPVPDDAVTDAVRRNLAAAQAEDVAAYMSTIDEKSPGFEDTDQKMRKLFADFDLAYELEKIEVVENKNGEAIVKFTQVTKKVAGPEYKDNRISGVHLLKKSGDRWKLFATEVKEITYL